MGIRDFVSVLREISFDDLETEARMPPRILVISTRPELAVETAKSVFGPNNEEFVHVRSYADRDIDPLHYDVILTVGPLDSGVARQWRELFRRVKEPLRMVEHLPHVDAQKDIEALRRRIADCADDRAMAIGRYIPSMKSACARQLISETSTVNAEFALVSNIPSVVPVIGTAFSVGADFIVLTKNQLMLIFKLAAVNGRDLDNRWRIYAEMTPVVGAGLAWRTVAREVVTLLPLAIGTVPKVAIAFAGTWVIGESAQVYFERGERLNRAQVRELYAQALETLRKNPIKPGRLRSLRPGRRSGGDEPDEATATG
ncbi:MAG: hypothetical protein WBW04_17525 [Nitrolancea sp.]